MKRTTMKRKGFMTALALCALVAGIAAAAPWTRGLSQTTDEPTPVGQGRRKQTTVYGLHTLARNQTLRLSVVNTKLLNPPDPVHDGEANPPEPVRLRHVTLAFDVYAQEAPDPSSPYAGDGSVRNLRIVRSVSRSFRLRPGEAAALEIEASRANEVVGAWTLADPPEPGTPGEATPPDPVRTAMVTSLEVRQGNSTQMVLPGTTRGFNPQPDPPSEP